MTTENNELIAEFMELEKASKDFLNECNPKEYYVREYNSGEWYLLEEMQYHTSWDWLMAVISKCLEVGGDISVENIYHSLHTQDMSFAYKSVVEFIKEYNN